MNKTRRCRSLSRHAFSLVEALLTVGIMSILSTIVITAVSNATQDAGRMVARQQQSAVQNAVQAWVNSMGRYPDTYSTVALRGKVRSLEDIRTIYNGNYGTSLARFNAIATYLDDTTANHIISSTTNSDKLKSDALTTAKQYLSLPSWSSGSYPKVNLVTEGP